MFVEGCLVNLKIREILQVGKALNLDLAMALALCATHQLAFGDINGIHWELKPTSSIKDGAKPLIYHHVCKHTNERVLENEYTQIDISEQSQRLA